MSKTIAAKTEEIAEMYDYPVVNVLDTETTDGSLLVVVSDSYHPTMLPGTRLELTDGKATTILELVEILHEAELYHGDREYLWKATKTDKED